MNPAQPGDIVRILFTGRQENGAVFESSETDEPIQLALGSVQMIAELDRALVGIQVGEKKTVTVPVGDGFGPRRLELQQQVPRTALSANAKVGDRLLSRSGNSSLSVWARALDEATAVVDGKHPLAGQTLTFDIEMAAIESAGLEGGKGRRKDELLSFNVPASSFHSGAVPDEAPVTAYSRQHEQMKQLVRPDDAGEQFWPA
jgi:peptidylprolyl isomerase